MVHGDGPSSVRQPSRAAAEVEAQRLARQNPGVEFFVLEAIAMHRRVDVERVDLREQNDGELPF